MSKRNILISIISELYKKLVHYKQRRRFNAYVMQYYKENRNKKITYMKNIWSKNFLWDFFFQSLQHCEKSKYYVPGDYYAIVLEPTLNKEFTCFGSEKNMYEKVFSNCGVIFPKTILRCMNHIYLDRNYKCIRDTERLLNCIQEEIIVKPTVGAYCGKDIRKYSFVDDTLYHAKTLKFDIDEITQFYKGNFIIQAVVNQHPKIAKFHPYSLNTVRAFSYRSVKTNVVHVPTVTFRMGVNHSYLDTVTIGGIACGLTERGKLMKYALDLWGNYYTHHPTTNVRFENFTIPSFHDVIKVISRLANVIPHQRLAGWDFGIDRDGNPVLIEVNVSSGSWHMQTITGAPLFGRFSQEVKEYMDSLR